MCSRVRVTWWCSHNRKTDLETKKTFMPSTKRLEMESSNVKVRLKKVVLKRRKIYFFVTHHTGFEIEHFEDLKESEMEPAFLKVINKLDFGSFNFLLVFVMAHGKRKNNDLYVKCHPNADESDGDFQMSKIFEAFQNDKMPQKFQRLPVFFIIQVNPCSWRCKVPFGGGEAGFCPSRGELMLEAQEGGQAYRNAKFSLPTAKKLSTFRSILAQKCLKGGS